MMVRFLNIWYARSSSGGCGLDLKGNAGFASWLRSGFPEWVDYVGGPPQHVLCKDSTQLDVKTG